MPHHDGLGSSTVTSNTATNETSASSAAPCGGPLHGVTIIDMTAIAMGPFGTQYLGDMGAEVIKIEPPEGDVFRWVKPSDLADEALPSLMRKIVAAARAAS